MRAFQWPSIIAAVLAAVLSVLGNRQFPLAIPSPAVIPPPTPPTPTPPTPKPPEPTKDPLEALGRLVMSGGFCSATPVTPPDKEGCQILLSAAHCVKRIGEECQHFTRSGRMVRCRVIALNRDADAALLETEGLKEPLAYLLVATQSPPKDTPVFHAGFGRDKPGNTETGKVLQSDTGSGQVMYALSVSPGDSGGGICLDSNGCVVSPVCCTTKVDAYAQVFGAKPEVVQKMLKQPAFFVDVPPMPMPMR